MLLNISHYVQFSRGYSYTFLFYAIATVFFAACADGLSPNFVCCATGATKKANNLYNFCDNDWEISLISLEPKRECLSDNGLTVQLMGRRVFVECRVRLHRVICHNFYPTRSQTQSLDHSVRLSFRASAIDCKALLSVRALTPGAEPVVSADDQSGVAEKCGLPCDERRLLREGLLARNGNHSLDGQLLLVAQNGTRLTLVSSNHLVAPKLLWKNRFKRKAKLKAPLELLANNFPAKGQKENELLSPPPFVTIYSANRPLEPNALKFYKWNIYIELLYTNTYPGNLLGEKVFLNKTLTRSQIRFNNLRISRWGYDYFLKVNIFSVPSDYNLQTIIGPFNVEPQRSLGATTGGKKFVRETWSVTVILENMKLKASNISGNLDKLKLEVLLINYYGLRYSKVLWKSVLIEKLTDAVISFHALIEGPPEIIKFTQSLIKFDLKESTPVSLDGSLYVPRRVTIEPETSPDKMALEKADDSPKGKSEATDSNGMSSATWVTIIVCNVLMVTVVVVSFSYCCFKKKRRGSRNDVTPSSPGPLSVKAHPGTSSIESFRYITPPNSGRIFTIEQQKGAFKEEPLFVKSDRMRNMDIEATPIPVTSSRNSNYQSLSEMSMRSAPLSKFRAISRVSARIVSAKGSFHYNPEESPSAKMFADRYKDMYPTDPVIYNPPLVEEMADSDLKAGRESTSGEGPNPRQKDVEIMSIISDGSDDSRPRKINGDSGFVDNAGRASAQKGIKSVLSVDEDSDDEPLRPSLSALQRHPILQNPAAVIAAAQLSEEVEKGHQRSSSEYQRVSTSVQTSPVGSWFDIPGMTEPLDDNDDGQVYVYNANPNERKYFIYLVSDNKDMGPYYKKDCIGRIVLPPRKRHLTLSELREQLLRSDDEHLRGILKSNKSFRFLTETYRFVAQNEAIAPVDEVYPAQGIFIKFSDPSAAISLSNETKGHNLRKASNIVPSFINISLAELRNSTTNKPPAISSQIPRLPLNKKDKLEAEKVSRQNSLRKRHIECVSPLPMKHKLHQRRQSLLYMDIRKTCDNPTCNKRPIFKCAKCSTAAYCSPKCKKEHWSEHRLVCTRPPWKF